MGRIPRIHFSGAIYHVFSRGVDGRDIYLDDSDRVYFLSVLTRVCSELSVELIAYCLMGNHYHLAVKIRDIPLGVIMHRILTPYALRFNARYDRAGHLLQARYNAKICLDAAYLSTVVRYIHTNPVKAGLVTRPSEWPWSSAGPSADEDFGAPDDYDPWKREPRSLATLIRVQEIAKVEIDEIAGRVLIDTGVPMTRMKSKTHAPDAVSARRRLAREAVKAGHSMTAVALWLGSSVSSVSRHCR